MPTPCLPDWEMGLVRDFGSFLFNGGCDFLPRHDMSLIYNHFGDESQLAFSDSWQERLLLLGGP